MQNASLAFGFVTQNSSLGGLLFTYLEMLGNFCWRSNKEICYRFDIIE